MLLGMLAELEASHTTIIDAAVFQGMACELSNRRCLTFGVLLEESLPGRVFVRALYEGGPGARAGLRVGDRIVEVDGIPVAQSRFLLDAGYDPGLPGAPLFFLRAEAGGRLALTVQPHPDGDTRQRLLLEPASMNAVDAARNSVAVLEQDGVSIGTLHIWFCSEGVTQVLRDALQGPLARCDALVLDVRGRGGYAQVATQILDAFRGRQSFRQQLRGERGAPLWTKPVVLLADERSRSAKEILAYQFRAAGLGKLVGQRTEGAVLGAVFHALPDGSYLELAAVAVPVGGVSLEGVGVPPDHEVDFVVPYARGADPILSKGCEVAVDEVRQARRRARGRRPV
ncbi:MAG: hypothetical protein HY812_02305 [Planctomycetes bacterium]|nr:hypothetical protein [Planctomycetota bacterium]